MKGDRCFSHFVMNHYSLSRRNTGSADNDQTHITNDKSHVVRFANQVSKSGLPFTLHFSPLTFPSRTETLNAPSTVDRNCVKKTIMEPVLSPLPEFHSLGSNAVTAPKLRHWRVTIRIPRGDFFESAFELSPARDRVALRRDDGAEPALQRSFIEVCLGFVARNFGNITFDLDLSL